MDFNNLHNDTSCQCLENTFEDFASTYVRKISKPILRPNDFESKWERSPERTAECKVVCGLKGISVSKFAVADHENEIIQSCIALFPIAPKYKPHLCFFKTKQSAGLFKNTPSSRLAYHHDFYKADDFSIDRIETIKIVPLSNYV